MERPIKTKECWLFFSLTVLGIGPRILYILDKLSTTKSHTPPLASQRCCRSDFSQGRVDSNASNWACSGAPPLSELSDLASNLLDTSKGHRTRQHLSVRLRARQVPLPVYVHTVGLSVMEKHSKELPLSWDSRLNTVTATLLLIKIRHHCEYGIFRESTDGIAFHWIDHHTHASV